MSGGPSQDALVQQLQLLLSGYGYNFYDQRNVARADDLLVRQRASDNLGQAGQALAALETEYRRRFIPPATRDSPYPPIGPMEKLREIGRLRALLADLETRIRSMPVPTQDKIWWRFRQEQALLQQLLTFDYHLLQQTQQIEQQVGQLNAQTWHDGPAADNLTPLFQQLETTIRGRRQLLLSPL